MPSAFGCGAFRFPAPAVAQLYRDESIAREDQFVCTAFAIFHAGYGPDSFSPLREMIGGGSHGRPSRPQE